MPRIGCCVLRVYGRRCMNLSKLFRPVPVWRKPGKSGYFESKEILRRCFD